MAEIDAAAGAGMLEGEATGGATTGVAAGGGGNEAAGGGAVGSNAIGGAVIGWVGAIVATTDGVGRVAAGVSGSFTSDALSRGADGLVSVAD